MTTKAPADLGLVVSEIFGPTVQGEGPAAGRRCAFLRLGGCNLTCSWCDSGYTWDASRFDLREEMTRLPMRDVLDDLRSRAVDLVVITGGEPLLQQGSPYALTELATRLALDHVEVHIETNGTLPPDDMLTHAVGLFVVSPKLDHAGMERARTIRWPVLKTFGALARAGRAVLKVVCATVDDVAEAAALGDGAGFPRAATWVMPLGTTTGEIVSGLAAITDPALALGLNVSGRQHVLTWGCERGH